MRSLCQCVQVLSRNAKLLINHKAGGSAFTPPRPTRPPPSAAMGSISHSVPNLWRPNYNFPASTWQFYWQRWRYKSVFVVFHFFFPLHHHSTSSRSPAPNQTIFYTSLRFVSSARKCVAKWQMVCVCVVCLCMRVQCVCVQCVCVCVFVCVHALSPPGCPENNCPGCFFLLVMVCCYLSPWRTEKK